ncbi:MAG: hypothetical protein KGI73_02510 [Patescibacteria group bacterium]|nr:hypothetical protein [Patescibacteria group bacterium]
MQQEPEETLKPRVPVDAASIFLPSDELEDSDAQHARLKYHLASGDFFNTVATVVGFLEGSLIEHSTENPELATQEVKLAQALRRDLMYLNEHYRIEPKNTTA